MASTRISFVTCLALTFGQLICLSHSFQMPSVLPGFIWTQRFSSAILILFILYNSYQLQKCMQNMFSVTTLMLLIGKIFEHIIHILKVHFFCNLLREPLELIFSRRRE